MYKIVVHKYDSLELNIIKDADRSKFKNEENSTFKKPKIDFVNKNIADVE